VSYHPRAQAIPGAWHFAKTVCEQCDHVDGKAVGAACFDCIQKAYSFATDPEPIDAMIATSMIEANQIDSDELRAELARQRVTQRRLASLAGVSATVIGGICSGRRPSARVAAAILDALGPEGARRVLTHTHERARAAATNQTARARSNDDKCSSPP
jgi:hypothetical protein